MIGVLGGGQLGRMLALAGVPLGERFVFLDPNPDAPAGDVGELVIGRYDDPTALLEIARRSDLVTYEFENVPASSAELLERDVAVYPPRAALEAAQDRLAEKRLFESAGLDVPAYRGVASADELHEALDRVGLPAVVKSRSEGYDGKGQVVVRSDEDLERARSLVEARPCIAESLVPFERELSVIGVRGRTGELRVYPVAENHHRDGILRLTLAPAPDLDPTLQARAESVVGDLMERLGYVGVLAVELFEVDGELMGNEMAPRVHNSGHWTQDGSITSQFENHVRALLGLPLGATDPIGVWAMVNLIGGVPDPVRLLEASHTHLHLYRKQPRPGRKLGHLNLGGPDLAALRRGLEGLPETLGTSGYIETLERRGETGAST